MSEEKKKYYTISVYTENKPGLVHKVTIIFTRRRLNIENIIASESEIEGVYRYTIGVITTETMVRKVVKQIEKQIGVYKAFFHDDDNIVYQEIALYKMPTDVLLEGNTIEQLLREHHARLLSVEREFMIIEKTGHKEETQLLFEVLKPFGVLEFVRSGRVAITRPMKEFITHLEELREAHEF